MKPGTFQLTVHFVSGATRTYMLDFKELALHNKYPTLHEGTVQDGIDQLMLDRSFIVPYTETITHTIHPRHVELYAVETNDR